MKYAETYTIKIEKDAAITKKTVWGRKDRVCQTCRFHRNKPSRCGVGGGFVNRKQEACDDYRR